MFTKALAGGLRARASHPIHPHHSQRTQLSLGRRQRR